MFEFLCIVIEYGWGLVLTSYSIVFIETYGHTLMGLSRFQLEHCLIARSLSIKLVLLTSFMMSLILL